LFETLVLQGKPRSNPWKFDDRNGPAAFLKIQGIAKAAGAIFNYRAAALLDQLANDGLS